MLPPDWSSTSNVNPPKLPMLMPGGENGITSAPWMPSSGPRSRGSSCWIRDSADSRWSNGLSRVKISP
jgi:hypothetical protein